MGQSSGESWVETLRRVQAHLDDVASILKSRDSELSRWQVGAHFDRRRSSYEREAIVHRECAELLVEMLSSMALSPERILEIGVHTGLLTKCWRAQYPEAKAVLLDLTQPNQNLLDGASSLLVADGEQLPCRPQSFDVLISGATFQWYKHWSRAMQRHLEVLRPKGWMAFSQFCEGSLWPLDEILPACGRPDSLLPLLSYADIVDHFHEVVPHGLKQQILHERTLYFDSFRELLEHLRAMGVTASPQNARPWTASQYRKAEELSEAFRCSKGIPLKYVVGIYLLQNR